RDYLAGLAQERRRRPGEDLLSALVQAEEAGDVLSEDELLTTAALLFAAGFETTTNLLANSLVALLRHPAELRLLRDEPGLAQAGLLRRFPRLSLAGEPGRRDSLSIRGYTRLPVSTG